MLRQPLLVVMLLFLAGLATSLIGAENNVSLPAPLHHSGELTQPSPAGQPATDRQAASAATAAAETPAAILPTYPLKYGDQVLIEVFKQPDLRFAGVVPPSGRILFPMIGQLQLHGRTAEQIADEVSAALKKQEFVTQPFVVVQITELAPSYVYIRGAVARPAAVALPVGQSMRLTQLLAAAGGPLEEVAIKERVQVIRFGDEKTPASKMTVNLTQLEADYDFDRDPVLMSGDEVFVPRRLIPRVIVIGAVTNPQAVELADGRKMTLSEAIAKCGGLREEADHSTIQLQLSAATTAGLLTFNLKTILDGKLPDVELSDGDRIYVPTVDGIVVSGRVKEPGVVYARPGVTMTVTRALSMSGGFISYASRNEVYVIKKNSTKPMVVDVGNILKTGDLSNDLELSPGDVVIVPEGIW